MYFFKKNIQGECKCPFGFKENGGKCEMMKLETQLDDTDAVIT